MNGMGRLLDDPVVLRLGLALLHFLWQGTVVAAVAALALVVLRRASPATRYVSLLAVLAVMAATPVATYLVMSAAPRPVAARSVPALASAPSRPGPPWQFQPVPRRPDVSHISARCGQGCIDGPASPRCAVSSRGWYCCGRLASSCSRSG